MMIIAVCGAGTMGSGIAQVSAQAGFDTILFDLEAAAIERAKGFVSKSLQQLVDRKKITAEQQGTIFSRIKCVTDASDCVADLVIEAIVEKAGAKIDLFNTLAAYNSPESIFASNTSSL